MDIKVFISADADVRLGRRIKRDIQERNRTLDFSLAQYLIMSKPMHAKFVEPNKQCADIIVPQGGKNKKALRMVLSLIKNELS